jgi:signal transduction histidine kinase
VTGVDQVPNPLDCDQLAQRWDFTAQFAGRLAHDLSNIFTGVNGFTELALFQMAADHPARAHLRDVQQSGQRGIGLAQELHLLRTCAASSPATTTVALALEQAEIRLQPTSGANWQADIPAALPPVALGIEPLAHVLVQLLENAIEAGGTSPVRVSAAVVNLDAKAAGELLGRAGPGQFVEVSIGDKGPGLPPNAVTQALTAPMFSTKPGHRGFGLVIVFRTLYAYRGGFRVEPTPDQGTMARIYLPVVSQGPAS